MADRSQAGRTGRARGRQRELATMAEMAADGWVIGDRSRAAGPGDFLATRAAQILTPAGAIDDFIDAPEVRLVEVKSTSKPFERFGPAERAAMLEVAERAGATAWLAHWPKGGKLRWIPESEWPVG